MKNSFFLTLFCCVCLLMTSCDDDGGGVVQPSGDVALSFTANFGDSPLIMNAEYAYEDGTPIIFNRFQYYISNVTFIESTDPKDDATEVAEIDLIDYSELDNLQSATDGIILDLKNIPVGSYTGIRFGVGVADDLNRTSPSEYGASHPLSSESGHYWAAWESYIFSKIEGRADLDGDGTFEQGIVYHMGASMAYREVTLNKSFTVTEDEELPISIAIDLRRILVRSEQNFFDIGTTTAIHEDDDLVNYLMDNFDNAFEIE